ncbi:hypothetical protein B0H63DRAFT_123303 [Podospora didyma]|uniref:SMODS and SLOG-associating 2TM effector domain-containing protein n=1 Tax=Podospora didyma TaxID=330526 RepID=A0AAE0U4R7_9PEZI|nr:hypothetical protein B0H63DRAFT_123303 [Podospora didyma]
MASSSRRGPTTEDLDEQSPLLKHNASGSGFSSINPVAPRPASIKTDIPASEPTSQPEPAPSVVSDAAPVPAAATTPTPPAALVKSDTDATWGDAAGLHVRQANDENLVIFRRAVGINMGLSAGIDSRSLEEGRQHAMGMYASTLRAQSRKNIMYLILTTLIYTSHFSQIIVGAAMTALGPTAGEHTFLITVLGAVNTIVAGLLALVKGQGLPERLRKDQAEFRKLQDWIEQTEALLAVGVIGRDRKEVGYLVQVAFKKYNAAKASEENNVPENYVRAPGDVGNGDPPQRSSSPGPAS